MIIFEIKNPKADESTPEAFRQILANVASQSPVSLFNRLVRGHRDPVLYLEIAMYQQAIHFYIVCEDYLRSYFNSQLTAQYPTAQIIPAKDYLPLLKSSKAVSFGQMKLRNVYYYPLTTFRNFREKDPMGSMLGILSKINSVLASHNINILGQYLKTNEEVGYVITDVNKAYNKEVIEEMKKIEGTIRLRVLY